MKTEWMVSPGLRISLRSRVVFPVPTSPVMTMKPFLASIP